MDLIGDHLYPLPSMLVLQNCRFDPFPLLRSGHLQTCLAALWNSHARIPYRAQQHQIPTSLGDRLVLHDDLPPEWQPGGMVVLLVHGLGGCHRSPYMVRIAEKLRERGVRVFRLDLRGCGEGRRLARHAGHAGRSEDLSAAVARVVELSRESPLVAAGFSLGGNLLLKYLGEIADRAPAALRRAICVNSPLDLVTCAQNMQRLSRLLYSRWFVRCLWRQLRQCREWIPDLHDYLQGRRPRTLYEFDDRITAPWSGFTGAWDYYARSTPLRSLSQVQVPTLLLTAADDPLVPVATYEALAPPPAVATQIVPHGGHLGFFGRPGADPDWHWIDWRILDFVSHAR